MFPGNDHLERNADRQRKKEWSRRVSSGSTPSPVATLWGPPCRRGHDRGAGLGEGFALILFFPQVLRRHHSGRRRKAPHRCDTRFLSVFSVTDALAPVMI